MTDAEMCAELCAINDLNQPELARSPFGRLLTRYSPWTAMAWPIVAAVLLIALMLGMLPEDNGDH